MTANIAHSLPLEHPDVLGMITGGVRLTVESIQCALAAYPRATAVGQPFEALLLVQNTCDKPVQLMVNVRLPKKDNAGNRLTLTTPKEIIPLQLESGETGLLHIPLVPAVPTQPSTDNTISIKLVVKTPRGAKQVRPQQGGRTASILNMSPFRLNILREVGFVASSSEQGALSDVFSVIPGQVEAAPAAKEPRYETLWSERELPQERAKYAELSQRAVEFAGSITRMQVMQPLINQTAKRFQEAGLKLSPMETLFIAKTLTYVMEDGLEIEPGFKLTESRWFSLLMDKMADPSITSDLNKLVGQLYLGVIHDAVRLGLSMIQRSTGDNLGNAAEHINYANEVLAALEMRTTIDLSHAYLPLILAGMMLNIPIKLTREDLWLNLDQIKEAWNSRLLKAAAGQYDWLAKVFSNFHYKAESELNAARIPRQAR